VGPPVSRESPGLGDDVPPVFLLSENGGEATVRSVDGGPLQFEEFWHRQDLYPGGSQAVFDPVHFTGRGVEGLVVFRLVSFPDEQAQRLFYDSLVSLGGNRYVRAPLGQSSDQPSGLMTLWVVLIALSSLAAI
jgi:hypothetical protein